MDLIDELIDRYGEPPKAIQGLITVALLRNMAGSLGITEITQRSGMMLFYVKTATMEQIQALVKTFKGRVTVNGSDKPYIAVKIAKDDNPMELMGSVINIMHENKESAEK